MKALMGGLIALAAAAVVGIVLFFVFVDSSEETDFSLENTSFSIDGSTMNCAQLWGSECDYNTQWAFNKWGMNLDRITTKDDLGAFAREVGPQTRAKLALEGCIVSMRSDNSVLNFEESAQDEHPGVSSADLFPIWDFARTDICRPVM